MAISYRALLAKLCISTAYLLIIAVSLPGENTGSEPSEYGDDHGTTLGANVSGL